MAEAALVAGGLGAAASLSSAASQSRALRMQGEYQEAIARMNSKQMELQAEEYEIRGNSAANRRAQEIRQAKGTQKAAMAAAGVDVTSDMATNILDETEAIGAADIAAIKVNAYREAMGMKSQAGETLSKAAMQKNANFFQARQTMITGGLTAASQLASGGYSYYSAMRGK